MIKVGNNPAFKEDTFRGMALGSSDPMTIAGTINKTGFLLILCLMTSWFSYNNPSTTLIMIGGIGGFILALVTMFKQSWSPVTAPIYSLLEGLALGGISVAYQAQYGSIVFNAICLTFCILFSMLTLYRSGLIKVNDTFRSVMRIAMGGVFLIYMASIVMGFFGSSIPMIHESSPLGIGFSIVVVGIASFSLLTNFDFIEKASESGSAPKYMEWYGAFGIMITLVWLYLELLRLLSKLNRR